LNGLKKQRRYYSGKKRRHTLKSQIVVAQRGLQILCTAHGKGREHDFRLFKRSRVKPAPAVEVLADKGYQGIQRRHLNSHTPTKKPAKQVLSATDKQSNRRLAKRRVVVEQVIGKLKVFQILAHRYRNRRRRFALRFNLIAALYNFELTLPALV
jgi:hypothetical protein